MKRTSALTAIIFLTLSFASAQNVKINGQSGYMMINEVTSGFGLQVIEVPYSNSYFGMTTTHGYQFNKSFFMGGGTGVSVYKEGTLVPIFTDFRYRFMIGTVTPYIFGDAGILLGDAPRGSKSYLNGGLGVLYTVKDNIGINFATGLLTQNNKVRDSFLSFKLGVVISTRL
jgi:hypothetical protein